jgi:hypothetical protein
MALAAILFLTITFLQSSTKPLVFLYNTSALKYIFALPLPSKLTFSDEIAPFSVAKIWQTVFFFRHLGFILPTRKAKDSGKNLYFL